MKEPAERIDQARPSKSERKRQATRLQNLGQRLVDLGSGDLAQIPLTAALEDAIALYKKIQSREARRRQLQFIGKLMRDLDTTPIETALAAIDGASSAARYEFHQLEIWRDRLLTDPDALTHYLHEHPHADRQRLRQLLTRVASAPTDDARKKLSRDLFRMLREFGRTAADT